MVKKQKMLEDLFHETLKDMYYAEKKILTALPKMARAAQSEDLRAAFEKHERETRDHVERLEQVFALIEQPARGKTCDGINGIIDEGQEVMKEFKGSAALDAGLHGHRSEARKVLIADQAILPASRPASAERRRRGYRCREGAATGCGPVTLEVWPAPGLDDTRLS